MMIIWCWKFTIICIFVMDSNAATCHSTRMTYWGVSIETTRQFQMTLFRFTCVHRCQIMLQFHSMFKSRPVLGNRVCHCNTLGWRMNRNSIWNTVSANVSSSLAALIHRHCQDRTAIFPLSIHNFTCES